MSAPDFIWAEAPDIFDGMSIWYDNGMGPGTPYVRRDPAVLAELPEVQAMLREGPAVLVGRVA